MLGELNQEFIKNISFLKIKNREKRKNSKQTKNPAEQCSLVREDEKGKDLRTEFSR